MTDYCCENKGCPNAQIVFTWDNVEAGVVCRSCGVPLSVCPPPKPTATRKAKSDD